MRLWGGRFSEANDARVEAFTSSIDVDRELAADDLAGSIAHVRGLGRAGLLTDEQVAELVAGLTSLAEDVAADRFTWDPALEDVHLNLEAALAERIGPVAGRLHTGRSRNDQVATDLRLWTRRAIDRLDDALVGFERSLVGLAEREGEAVLPGHDPHPAGAAGPVRPPPARLRRDGRAGPGSPRRRAPARQREPARCRGAGGRRVPARPRDDGARARVRRGDGQLARRRQRSRLRRRRAGGGRPWDGAPQPARGGDHVVVEPAVRVRAGRRRVLDRQLDHAQQEEPGSRPSSSAAAPPASSGP